MAQRNRRTGPKVETRKPHPLAWKIAKRAAGGDTSRLTVGEDGSVTAWRNAEVAEARR